MKHRYRVLANSDFFTIGLAAFLCVFWLFSSAPIAAQTRAKAGKSRGHAGRVQTGLDVLEAEKFAPLRGKHVALITNHTGLDYQDRTTINVLAHSPGVQVVPLFSPDPSTPA